MNQRLSRFLLVVLLALSTRSFAEDEKPDPGLLTLDRIYDGDEFSSKSMSVRWMPDGATYTTLKSVDGIEGRSLVLVDPASDSETVLVTPARLTPSLESETLAIDGYALSPDRSKVLVYTNSKRVWRRKTRGDYWVLDLSSHDLRKLGGDASSATLMFAKFAPDSNRVAYVRERNIYVEDLLSGDIAQLTQTETPDVINGTFDWVYEEELGLRDGFRWSPDGRKIAYWRIDTTGVPRIPLVNNTAGLYPELLMLPYPKTGQTNPICQVGVVDIASQKTRWIPLEGDNRDHYVARMEWGGDSSEIFLQRLNRLQNTNTVLLAKYNGERFVTRSILTEHDDAWVNVHDEMQWLSDRKHFTWLGEQDGWRHLYLVAADGSEYRLVTDGPYDVIRLLRVDEQRKLAYFIASPDSAAQRHLYSIGLDGNGLRRVTPSDMTGTHDYSISPDGTLAIHTSSSFDSPPATSLVSLPEHKSLKVMESNEELHKKVAKLHRQPVEFLRVDIGDGVELDGWCMKPPEFDAAKDEQKRYPVLVYVYGDPAGQTVLDRWRGTAYLWHQMLAQRGYIVMSFDNRGTPAPRGREWRKCVYRQVGILSAKEQAAALREMLRTRPYIDAKRVGIWGWSGGGSSSLQAIFKYPDLYHTAISIAPVPNQRYYDTIYQERYMGLPNDNVAGYRDGSAMNFAKQLKGNLLLIHGTGDDNCHYQTTEMLINELVRHNKPFTMMAYPYRTHAIREGKNTTRHLRGLMTRYLEEKLPPRASD